MSSPTVGRPQAWHSGLVTDAGDASEAGHTSEHSPEPASGPGPVHLDLSGWRREYRQDPGAGESGSGPDGGLDESQLDPDPFVEFARWLAQAVDAPQIIEPNAMVLATATPQGMPSARLVLLKAVEDDGFVFYTNHRSRKAQEMAANPSVALTFPWHAIARQVRVEGMVERVGVAQSANYFHSRPREAQLGTWASWQSVPVRSRAELEARYAELAARWPVGTTIPVPDFWGGYRVVPHVIEFWVGRPARLHDRISYHRQAPDRPWSRTRLSP